MPLGREALATLDLDVDLIELLAQTSFGAARSRQRDWQIRRERVGELPARQRSILPRLDEDQLLLAQAATFLTMSAAYSLLLGDADEARAAYVNGSDLLRLIGSDEAGVLDICVGRAPARPTHSGWLHALVRAFVSANGNEPNVNERPPVHLSSQTSPALNISTESLDAVALDMMESERQDTNGDEVGHMLEEMLTRLARPVDRLLGSARWREQTTELLPIEPELLAVAMIAIIWTRRKQGRLDVDSVVASVALSAASAMLEVG